MPSPELAPKEPEPSLSEGKQARRKQTYTTTHRVMRRLGEEGDS